MDQATGNKNGGNIRATVHLDPALQQRVRKYMAAQGRSALSFSEVVVNALVEFLDRRGA